MMTGVLVFSEDNELLSQLLTPGRTLANSLGAPLSVALVDGNGGPATLGEIPDKVFKISSDALQEHDARTYASALVPVATEEQPRVVLIGATKFGNELAPCLATKLKAGCSIDCRSLELTEEGEDLRIKRLTFSGNAVEVEEFSSYPQIATVPLNVFEPMEAGVGGGTPEIVERTPEVAPSRVKLLRSIEPEHESVDIEKAQIIVSCGRGVKAKEDIQIIEELAKTIGGVLGCSRPMVTDLKWLSHDHWVGLSGHKVKPKVYIACGISGQIQHQAGMRDSGMIVAINTDPDAPIFKIADYGIVGDLYKVVPEIIKNFKEAA